MSGQAAFPSFAGFYAAVNEGREPFPWQARLADEVVASGWPEEIGVPTGLGKTACIDIAVWALAAQASRSAAGRTLATRVFYVVNRRLLVDVAYEHGLRLARALSDADASPVLRQVADALRSIRGFGSEHDAPLTVSRLRGGADLGQRPPHPAQPALVFATVPMFASSWLFRGYASSSSMRPVDAAHAGVDSLVLLDEAHLSRPLLDLADPVRQCDVGDPTFVLNGDRCRPVFVSLTATGGSAEPFTLDAEDESHPVERERLDAMKPTELVEVDKKAKDLHRPMVEALGAVLVEQDEPVASVIFTNTPAQARNVFDLLVRDAAKKNSVVAGADIVLLTGRMRQREAEFARAAVLDPVSGAPSGRDRTTPRDRSLIVVATQTLEVGADLDFDVMVTETCGVRSLIQRLGRCNRLGRVVSAKVVVVHPGKERDWPVYGTEPAEVWRRLGAAHEFGEVLDLAPARVADVLGEPADVPARVAELLPAHLWEWAKTTTPPPGEAPVEPFFAGFDEHGPRVSVCWRAARFADGTRVVPSVVDAEAVDLPLYEVREVLASRGGADRVVTRLGRDRVSAETTRVGSLRPGDVLVLDVDDGLYDAHGWAPESTAEVLDVSLARWPGLPLDDRCLRAWLDDSETSGELLKLCVELDVVDDPLADPELPARFLEAVHNATPRPEFAEEWRQMVDDSRPVIEALDGWLLLRRRRAQPRFRGSVLLAADAFDDLSANVTSVELGDHCASVGEIAGALARAVGVAPDLVAAVEAAGRFHDLGKSDPRFQRWLDPDGSAAHVLAKSTGDRRRWRADRAASGWPAGGRHEELSARLVRKWLEEVGEPAWDAELVIHLVVSHHGFGRPLVSPVEDREPVRVSADIDGKAMSVSGDLSVCDWDQPSRFRRCCERYGYWGLALLEAIVRQADHLASSRVDAETQRREPVVIA